MSDPTDIPRPQLTQYDLLQMKKEEQRRKKRARMAMFRLRLKQLPPAEQEPFKARARDARARYKARPNRQNASNVIAVLQMEDLPIPAHLSLVPVHALTFSPSAPTHSRRHDFAIRPIESVTPRRARQDLNGWRITGSFRRFVALYG
ncbi:hypothetical protein C8R46DRAFT_1030421 [Mycena filopes]|nr:hypothetical protein C8R46DRAFT_1030421 [Mycena filopes]